MSASSVQFRNKESVIDAYSSRKVAAWSIWQGRQFMFKYEGKDIEEGLSQLDETLNAISKGSTAIYTLKVYEELSTGKGVVKIKSNTPDDGSFNFRLNDPEGVPTVGQMNTYQRTDELKQHIAMLENRIKELEEDEDEEEEESVGGINGFLAGLMGNPAIQNVIQNFFTNMAANLATPKVATALHGVPDNNQDEKINAAIETLKQCDEKLGDHLAKLASIAVNKPSQFKMLLSMLKMY